MNLAITGASGHIGGMVVAPHFSMRGLPLILPLRNPAKRPICPPARCAPLPTAISSWPGRR